MFRRKRLQKLLLIVLVLLAFSTVAVITIFPILVPVWLASQLGFRTGEYNVWIDKSVVTTIDGVKLVANIYHPQKLDKTPTILVRIPYSKTLTNTTFANVVGRMWAARGYTVVIQGTRGRYESSGEYFPFKSETQDGIETLEWLKTQPWYNGKIGMWGGSYFGYTQWVLASRVNPGLSALILQICSTDFHRMFYPGGAFSFESALYWAVTSYGKQDIPASEKVLKKGYEGFPLIKADDRAVQDIAFFNEWASHPEKDDYWKAIDGENRTKTLQAPALLMAGWYDPFLPTQIEDFIKIRREAKPEVQSATRLIIGPWAHARTVTFPDGTTPRNYRLESLAPSIPWFDKHLLNYSKSKSPVQIYVMGKNIWRDEQEFPLARAKYTNYYLHSNAQANTLNGDGVLDLTPPATEAPDVYTYNPLNPVPSAGGTMLGPRAGIEKQNDIETRNDVLVYTTTPLQEDTEVTGLVRLVLYVSTTAPNTDFTAKLVDVYPDGSAYNVSEGIIRKQYDSTKQPSQIDIDLWPTSQLFFKGHRIRLEVSSSNYPRFDRNPNTGRPIATEVYPVAAKQTVQHNQQAPSRLILPIVLTN
ncbi:MAG: CocE/NonD family hydrolase [Calothrix sp. C42_A2020_038]|nr:CocE/NonD family hydrolase [Calothrix sp. C42_A2020_038]